jgi:hypothetical protein
MAKHLGLLTDVSHAALVRATRETVAIAILGEFPLDPVIGPGLSHVVSVIGSVITSHGGPVETYFDCEED